MLSSGSTGGPGVQPVLLCTNAIMANVFAGDAIFNAETPEPILSAHFFPLSGLRLFPWSSSPPIHPCRPIQLIFSQRKYESTEINLSCLIIRSVPSLRQNAGLHMLVTLLKPCQVLSFSFVLFESLEERRCVSAVRKASFACGEMLAQASYMLLVHIYVGTTCYSQGCALLRPVPPSVYTSSCLLPPDYKENWWINNIQLSPAVLHTHKGLEVCWRMCVCSCLYLCRCLCGSVCDGMCACLVSLASLGGPGSPSCGWFPGPSWQEVVRKAFPLGQSQGQTRGGREKHLLHPRHQYVRIPFRVSLLWCVKHLKSERIQRHPEKRRAAVKSLCVFSLTLLAQEKLFRQTFINP